MHAYLRVDGVCVQVLLSRRKKKKKKKRKKKNSTTSLASFSRTSKLRSRNPRFVIDLKKKKKEKKRDSVSLEKKREREKLHYIRDIIFAQRRSERVLFPSTNYTTVGHTTTIIRVTWCDSSFSFLPRFSPRRQLNSLFSRLRNSSPLSPSPPPPFCSVYPRLSRLEICTRKIIAIWPMNRATNQNRPARVFHPVFLVS